MTRDTKELEQFLAQLFAKKGHPGIAVTIRGPEGILFQHGYGYRDIEHRLPADEHTIFGIASMSKSITALCLAILETEGKLRLSDPVTKYFPTLHLPGTPDECVTLRSIAMHRWGVPPMEPLEWSIAMNSAERDSDWYRQMRQTAPNRMDRIEQIVDYIAAGHYRMLGMPGEYMSYSNEGYAILSYVVDQAAGVPLEQFMQERIFGPLGMTRTLMDLDGSEARAVSGGNMTSLFERDEKTGALVQDDNWSILPPFRGCACVKSTASDITRYYKMLSDHGCWEGRQVIPREAVELLIGERFPVSEKPYYCLGLEKRLIDGRIVCEHAGGLHGVSTKGGLIEGGYAAAVLCNEGDADMDKFQWACYNFILGLPLDTTHRWAEPVGQKFGMPEALVGDYLAKEGVPAHCIVRLEHGRLTGSYSDQSVDYLYCGGTVFAIVSHDDPTQRISTVEFYLRDGQAWGARCYTRIYQRVNLSIFRK